MGQGYSIKHKNDGNVKVINEIKMKENPCLRNKYCINEWKSIEDERKVVFDRYWKKFNHTRKRDFLLFCMKRCDSKRNYKNFISNHQNIYKYFIFINNTCRQLLFKTFNISEKVNIKINKIFLTSNYKNCYFFKFYNVVRYLSKFISLKRRTPRIMNFLYSIQKFCIDKRTYTTCNKFIL